MNTKNISRHTRCFIAIAVFYYGYQALIAQNLVMNPSFEDFVQCPEDYGTFQDDVLFWTMPTIGSTDYFNTCSSTMTVDNNFNGRQETFHGNAYGGLYAYGSGDYREYIEGELKQKLEKDKRYIVSAMISLSEKSGYAVEEFGFLFASKEARLHTTKNIPVGSKSKKRRSNYLGVAKRTYFDDKKYWTEVKGEYVADGSERYIIFGNFKENGKTLRNSTGKDLKKAAYYYVDMISVLEVGKPFNLDEIYVFKGLNFDVDRFGIGGEVEKELKPLIAFLKENPDLNISIYGHTDNVGNKTYNKGLSEKRAKTVSLFLVDNGLSPFRIAWKGYGDTSPMAANATEEGREQNRRVEFIISKKQREYYASGHFEDEKEN